MIIWYLKRLKCKLIGHKFQKQIIFILNPSEGKGTGYIEVCQCCRSLKEPS